MSKVQLQEEHGKLSVPVYMVEL